MNNRNNKLTNLKVIVFSSQWVCIWLCPSRTKTIQNSKISISSCYFLSFVTLNLNFENHPVYFSVRPTIWKRLLLPCEAIMNNRLFWKLAWWYSIMVLRKDRRVEKRVSLARKLHPLGSKCEISWWEWEEGKEPPFKNAYFCK